MHITSAKLFESETSIHNSLIHPVQFAEQLIYKRNSLQASGFDHAQLSKVLVYRGLPSAQFESKKNARNLTQKAHWEQNNILEVTHRALKYPYLKDANGVLVRDAAGIPLRAKPQEKGVDVLCALALIREARDPIVDLVILASQDTDLVLAIDEARIQNFAKIETASWYIPGIKSSQQIRPTQPIDSTADPINIWNTKMERPEFIASIDPKVY